MANIPVEHADLWADNEFSALIIANNSKLPAGLALKLSYPSKNNQDTLNIANIPVNNTTLALNLISNIGVTLKTKLANWVLLVRALLDNSVCYLENSSADGRFKEKEIVTRNLFLANNLSEQPIENFGLLYAMISYDLATLNQLPEGVRDNFIAYAQVLQAGAQAKKKPLESLAKFFKTDIGVLKSYLKAYNALNTGLESCNSGKLFYLKLKPSQTAGKYNISTSMRNIPTEYQVTSDYLLQPLSFMRAQMSQIAALQAENILYISFARANNIKRNILITQNRQVLAQIYNKPENTNFCFEYNEPKGYFSVIDLCGSELSNDTQRVITISRISAVQIIKPDYQNLSKQLEPYGFDSTNAGTDFKSVLNTFKSYLDRYSGNLALLNSIYNSLQVSEAQHQTFQTAQQAIVAINEYVDLHNNYTTSYVRVLHLYMLRNPIFFPGYTGKPPKIEGISLNTRHQSLGVIE